MSRNDLVWALENLRFARDALSTLRIDRGVRDYLVAALRRNAFSSRARAAGG